MQLRVRVLTVATVLLNGCAFGRPAPGPAAPPARLLGTYEVSGHVEGIGPLTGWLSLEADGTGWLTTPMGGCARRAVVSHKAVGISCTTISLHVQLVDSGLASQATVWARMPAPRPVTNNGILPRRQAKATRHRGIVYLRRADSASAR